jgi:hypothetical protein
MSEQTLQLLNAFEALPSDDKQTFVVEIMRRARELPFDSGLIADEEIGEPGKAVFGLLDQEENAARAATTQSPFGAMRGEFEVPEDWDKAWD